MTEKELLDLKEKIIEAKNELAELKGQKTALMRQLKEQWGATSIEAAKKKLTKMEEDIKTLETNIESSIEELDEKYPEE